MRTLSIVLSSLILLAGCHGSASWGGAESRDKAVHVAMDDSGGGDHLSVTIPGFDAKVALPMLDLGRHVDLDGIKLAPDTRVRNIDIAGKEHDDRGDGHGQVLVTFTSPKAPPTLVDYYRRSAADAGYDGVKASAGALTATKNKKQFALAVSPDGQGSRGTITINGGE